MARGSGQPLVRQRKDWDCGIAALAFYSHIPYEEVFVGVVRRLTKAEYRRGLYIIELIKVAADLGLKLKKVHWRKVDINEDIGILSINWKDQRDGHWVVLREGTIIDPADPSVWSAEDYLREKEGRVATLLVEE